MKNMGRISSKVILSRFIQQFDQAFKLIVILLVSEGGLNLMGSTLGRTSDVCLAKKTTIGSKSRGTHPERLVLAFVTLLSLSGLSEG